MTWISIQEAARIACTRPGVLRLAIKNKDLEALVGTNCTYVQSADLERWSRETNHRVGQLYFIATEDLSYVKIGWTSTAPAKRAKELQTGCPHRLVVIGRIRPADIGLELAWHTRWSHFRVRPDGEWFTLRPALLDEIRHSTGLLDAEHEQ